MDRQACLSNFHFIRVPIFFAPYILYFYSLKAHHITFVVSLSTLHFTLYTLYFTLYPFLFTLYPLLFTLLILLPILTWHATIILLEAFVEIALIHKADFETNLGDGIFSFED